MKTPLITRTDNRLHEIWCKNKAKNIEWFETCLQKTAGNLWSAVVKFASVNWKSVWNVFQLWPLCISACFWLAPMHVVHDKLRPVKIASANTYLIEEHQRLCFGMFITSIGIPNIPIKQQREYIERKKQQLTSIVNVRTRLLSSYRL